jgi:hypothetical protein
LEGLPSGTAGDIRSNGGDFTSFELMTIAGSPEIHKFQHWIAALAMYIRTTTASAPRF